MVVQLTPAYTAMHTHLTVTLTSSELGREIIFESRDTQPGNSMS